MITPIAIIIAGIAIAAAILIVFRWEVSPHGGAFVVYKLDRWTGHVAICAAPQLLVGQFGAPGALACK